MLPLHSVVTVLNILEHKRALVVVVRFTYPLLPAVSDATVAAF